MSSMRSYGVPRMARGVATTADLASTTVFGKEHRPRNQIATSRWPDLHLIAPLLGLWAKRYVMTGIVTLALGFSQFGVKPQALAAALAD
jgi:hypothetical protein